MYKLKYNQKTLFINKDVKQSNYKNNLLNTVKMNLKWEKKNEEKLHIRVLFY